MRRVELPRSVRADVDEESFRRQLKSRSEVEFLPKGRSEPIGSLVYSQANYSASQVAVSPLTIGSERPPQNTTFSSLPTGQLLLPAPSISVGS